MTTAGPLPGLREEIETFFSWNPPALIPAPKAKPSTKQSTATRPPGFYDKHFSSDLIVKKVVPLASLVEDLARNADKALDAALETLPPLTGFTAEQRRHDMRDLDKVVSDEKGVANFYHMTTARYCTRVASMLALHPKAPEWQSLLFWTQSPIPSGYAIMDGQLRFMGEGVGQDKIERAEIVNTMDSKVRTMFEELRGSMSSLATWEMKSAPVGSHEEVMAAVRTLGEFNWTFCKDSDTKHLETKEKIRRTVVGPDAQAPPWSLPGEDRDEEIDIQPLQRPVIQSASASGSSTHPPPSSSEHGYPMKDIGKKRKRDNEEASEHGSPMGKGKKRNTDDDAYQDRHDITAQNLMQQAWAQAVRVDGTVIVLHSGNRELVCLRHRRSQTLYVSELIIPSTCSDPGYGKLHVGIYIAAIQDMMDRWQQRPESKPSGDGDDGDGGDLISDGEDQDDQGHNRGSGSGRKGGRGGRGHRKGSKGKGKGKGTGTGGNSSRSRGSAGRKGPTGDELAAIEKAIDAASNRDVVFLYLQYDVYDSAIPALFLRSAPSIMAHTRCPTPPFSPRDLYSYGLEDRLTIVLTSEIGRGATGVVHRGTLKPEVLDGAMPLDVVVKLAFDSEQRDALRNEYEVYRRLKSKGVYQGIGTALGIFDDSEGCACALVLLYAGVPLSDARGNLSISDCKLALSTLKSIHRAGILHGDIRRGDILISNLGITIIDFGHSKQCDDQEAKDEEMAQLRYYLRLEGKH